MLPGSLTSCARLRSKCQKRPTLKVEQTYSASKRTCARLPKKCHKGTTIEVETSIQVLRDIYTSTRRKETYSARKRDLCQVAKKMSKET